MNKLKSLLHLARKYEFLLFIVAVSFLSGEVFSNQWQVTEDGPAHIYNAVVARELFLHPGTVLNDVFELNNTPVPNCLGHMVLSTLTAFVPLDVADKILHLLTVLGMCFSFRFLARQINPEQPFYGWLIFPFVYTGIFYLGFYNFAWGIVLFLLTSATWMWAEKKPRSIWSIALLSMLSTLLLLCHLIPFLLFVFVAGSRILVRLFRKQFRSFFIESGILLLIIFPAFILTAMYYNGRTEVTWGYTWADKALTLNRLFKLSYLAVHGIKAPPYALFLSIILLIMIIVSVLFFLKRRKTQSPENNITFYFWGTCWIFILALVFIAPDDFGGSGALTSRLIEISTLFLLLFLVAGKLPKSIVGGLAVISFSVGMLMMQMRKDCMVELNNCPKKVMRLSKYIEENSTGVYIPITDNWLELHIGELAFTERKSAMLSNYETTHDFFMVKWSKKFPYNYTIGGLSSSDLPCSKCYWPAQIDKIEKHIDYVLLCKEGIEDPDCFSRLSDSLEKYYILKKAEVPFYLYQSKQSLLKK